ncbi:MAG: phosphoribosylformylglycinamidine synthase subunit PurL [Acidimicrobiales bacterium]
MTEVLHRALGLTDDEAEAITEILGRPPNPTELAMFSVMWSEHCSYKSSRHLLAGLPTRGDHVLVGPGENAGVIDVGDGLAVAVRIESHNHPSAIEPGQGAATGVGGILRDIFTMGARPVALLDSLHFGPLDRARNRWLVEGVVGGVAGYGNAVGVPTVGGEVGLRDCFSGNPLVNVMCVGLLPPEHLVLGRAEADGSLAVLLGSTTGRDGIGGVSILASAGLDTGAEAKATAASKRPSVQVGDPFEEKRLIEACLALYRKGLVTGIQDLGGAGLTCATSETASRGGMGMDVDLSAVPLREPGMTPAEILMSESQERMLAIVDPRRLDDVMAVCQHWDVRASVVGRVCTGGRLRVWDRPGGDLLADVPARSLHDNAPSYRRPQSPPADLDARKADHAGRLPAPTASECGVQLLRMLWDKSWVWRQYDHQLFLNTIVGPGDDAALLRLRIPGGSSADPVAGGTEEQPGRDHPDRAGDRAGDPAGVRAMALTVDSNSRWCALDPRAGTAMVVAEAVLNLACVGAEPVAVVNCLNFGNPEHPDVMWQLAEAIAGMGDACRALGLPVVGGNVSLYNASDGIDIDPTPVVGMVGLRGGLAPATQPDGGSGGLSPTTPTASSALVADAVIAVIGPLVDPLRGTAGRGLPGSGGGDRAGPEGLLDGSLWAEGAHGHLGGRLPYLDFEAHRAVAATVALAVRSGLVGAAHDIADGGLGLALAEMAVRGGVGFAVGSSAPGAVGMNRRLGHDELFSEAPSRVVVCLAGDRWSDLAGLCHQKGVGLIALGTAGGGRLVVAGGFDLGLEEARQTWARALAVPLDS